MEKLIITACICGAEVTKENNPAVPYTVEEIAREAKSAYDAGAAIIHLHVRTDDGTPTQDVNRFKECMDAIKAVCPDVIIQPSTGGATGMSNDERLQPITLNPEMATLDCGTCNFGGDEIFVNTENMIKDFGEKMIARNIKPEVEVFDKGILSRQCILISLWGLTEVFPVNQETCCSWWKAFQRGQHGQYQASDDLSIRW